MFKPITITDSVHDATSVYVDTYDDDPRIMIKVEDQTLLEYLRDDVEDSQAAARGAYTIEQAIVLRAALDKAITEAERHTPGEEVFELVDQEEYLWLYVADVNRWACAMDLNDEDDHVTVGAASHSLFVGFDKGAADIAEKFGIKA